MDSVVIFFVTTPWPTVRSLLFLTLFDPGLATLGAQWQCFISCYMGLSENSVPLNPMVNYHYPYEKWLFHWEILGILTQHFQTNPYHTTYLLFWCCSNAGKPSGQSSSTAPWTEPWRHDAMAKRGKTSAAEVTGQAKAVEAAESVESPVRHGSPCGFFGENVGKL